MAEFTPPQIPTEMRELAERSVLQARKVFEGFMGAVQKTTGSMDHPAAGMKDFGAKAVTFAETNVNAAFDLAQKLVHAKDIQEVLSLQTEYLKQQMETVQHQAREMGDVVQQATGVKK